MAEKLCSFCHVNCDMNKIQIKKDFAGREYICFNCYKRTGINDFTKVAKMTADEIRPYINTAKESDERRKEIKPDEYAIGFIEADSKNQYWSILRGHLSNSSVVHLYSDILSFSLKINDKEYDGLCDITENSDIFSEENNISQKNGLFSSRKCKNMSIVINCNCMIAPAEIIILIDTPVKFDGNSYASAVNSAVACINLLYKMTQTAVAPEVN